MARGLSGVSDARGAVVEAPCPDRLRSQRGQHIALLAALSLLGPITGQRASVTTAAMRGYAGQGRSPARDPQRRAPPSADQHGPPRHEERGCG
jgi:hypothetical protein